MKISGNSFCPCGSLKKYKKCCKVFHEGDSAKNALELMKSRYSAYAANNASYLMETTHRENPDYSSDIKTWEETLHDYFDHTSFEGLEIYDFVDGENEAYVTFKATISQGAIDASFVEKSKFVKVNGKWFYHSGKFIG